MDCVLNPFTPRAKATTTETRKAEKAIGLDWQKKNNNFARASRFFVHFFAVAARLRRESA